MGFECQKFQGVAGSVATEKTAAIGKGVICLFSGAGTTREGKFLPDLKEMMEFGEKERDMGETAGAKA